MTPWRISFVRVVKCPKASWILLKCSKSFTDNSCNEINLQTFSGTVFNNYPKDSRTPFTRLKPSNLNSCNEFNFQTLGGTTSNALHLDKISCVKFPNSRGIYFKTFQTFNKICCDEFNLQTLGTTSNAWHHSKTHFVKDVKSPNSSRISFKTI